jgi:hypothetical protein
MESTRSTWNDERMDEFAERTEENFREVRGEARELRHEMNGRFTKLEGKFDRRTDVAIGVMATGFVSLVLTHFIG